MKNPLKPPPMRNLRNYEWMNEWELVEWYTKCNQHYKVVCTKISWFDKIFMPHHKQKLLDALKENEKCLTLKIL